VFLAVAIAFVPPLFFGGNFADWINRGLVFLVISCPCALVISVPLSFFGGIANASRKGILIKGGNYLERLNSADTFIFDKTGTLTKGEFQVSQILPANITKEKLLEIAAFAEIHSSHPIAVSIQKSFGKDIDKNKIKNYTEIAGLGISAIIDEKTVLCGNKKLLEKFNISFKEIDAIGSIVYIAINNVYAGAIIVSDEIKPDSKKTISELKKLNANIIMLTGDKESAAKETASQLGINNFFASLLPDEKLLIVDQMEKDKKPSSTIVFVGDGVNDAPVLSRVDIAIAMGGLGSDAAREAADIVLMTDEPLKIIEGLKIAKSTHAIVWQNIIFALGIKGLVLIAGAFGFASIWAAVFADVGVTFIAVLNSIRALGK
jgi:Cd2+/Zn2+-exporting ATPase